MTGQGLFRNGSAGQRPGLIARSEGDRGDRLAARRAIRISRQVPVNAQDGCDLPDGGLKSLAASVEVIVHDVRVVGGKRFAGVEPFPLRHRGRIGYSKAVPGWSAMSR